MNVPSVLPGRLLWRFRRRHLVPALSGLVGLLLLCLVVRSMLIERMMLPRLALVAGSNVTSVAITPDGKTVLSGVARDADLSHWTIKPPADVSVWDATSGRLLSRLHGLSWRAEGVTVSPDGRYVVAAGDLTRTPQHGNARRVVVWDRTAGSMLWEQPGGLPISVSPNGRLVSTSSVLRDVVTGRSSCEITANIADDDQVGFTPDNSLYGAVMSWSYPGDRTSAAHFYAATRLHFWRVDTGQPVKDFPFTRVRAWDLSRDGHWLVVVSDKGDVVGGEDGSIVRRVGFQTGAVAWTRERGGNGADADPDSILNSVAVSPNGKYVVVEGPNCHLVVLDARTGRELFRPFVPHSRDESGWALPGGLAFSADGHTLVSRCGSQVLVWDASVLR